MKTCPLLWRQAMSNRSALLEKNVDLDRDASKTKSSTEDTGFMKDCLGAVCRFYTEAGACGLEQQQQSLSVLEQRVRESDERWENVLLSLVELTERFEVILTRIGERELKRKEPVEESVKKVPDKPSDETTNAPEEETLTEPSAETPAELNVEPLPSEVTEAELEAAQDQNSEGIAYYHDGELKKAHACFQKAIELNPNFVEAYNNLGLVETEQEDIDNAIERFQTAIELDPELSASYTNLGYVHYLQESYLEAIAMYEEALIRAENSSTAWTNLGNAHFKLGNLEQARQAWENAVTLDPSNTKAAQNLSQIPQDEGAEEDVPVPQEDPA